MYFFYIEVILNKEYILPFYSKTKITGKFTSCTKTSRFFKFIIFIDRMRHFHDRGFNFINRFTNSDCLGAE